ncbi:hypothetical protein Hanom_Chr03g00201141 [Helianthus anomalus]
MSFFFILSHISYGERGTIGDPLRGPLLPIGGGAAIQAVSQIGGPSRWGDTEEGRREKVGPPLFSTNENFLFFE